MHAAVRTALLFLTAFFFVGAQEPAPTPATPSAGADTGAAPRLPNFGGSSQQPQAYDTVITKDAKSKTGVFTVHEVKEKYYYEIPKAQLDREFLLVTQIARTTAGVGYGGQFVSERVVRWERNANKINLRQVNYDIVADAKTPISLAVKAANNDTIIMSFPIAAFGKEPGKEKEKEPSEKKEEAPEGPPKPAAAKEAPSRTPRAENREYKETGHEPSIIIEVTRLFTSD